MGEAAETRAGLLPGVVVAGRYKLVEPRGEGAMGAVWSATHLTLGHTVAIKFLHGNVASSVEPRARFEREAKLAARLGEASRHITRVTDHGIADDGTPFLVMELLRGDGLEKRLKRERRLPMTLVARITSQLCRALSVAHGAGVIHRDLKPANVFLCEGEEAGDVWVKLLDFGVAKATLENEENATTRAGALVGTPNYMSPEQIVGNVVDHRSDLWAVAAIVYRMAVGKAPFGSGSLSELAMRIVSLEAPTPSTQAPDLPHEFDLWVKKGLAKDPAQRFQSARELSDSLAMVAGISATGSTGAYSSGAAERLALQIGDSVGGLQHTVDGSALAPVAPLPVVEKPRSRAPIFAALGVLIVGGAAVGIWAAQRTHAPSTMPGAPNEEATATATATAKKESVAATTTTTAASASTTTSTSATATATATATAKGGAAESAAKSGKKIWVAPKTPTKPTSTVTAPTTAPPTATAAPAATDKSNDLWKKKDEM